MSRTFKCAKAGFIAGSLSLLLSQTAFASIVSIRVPTAQVHITAPIVHTPAVHFNAPAASLQTHVSRDHRGDLPKGGRNQGSQTSSKGLSVVTATAPGTNGRNWNRGGAGSQTPALTYSPEFFIVTPLPITGAGAVTIVNNLPAAAAATQQAEAAAIAAQQAQAAAAAAALQIQVQQQLAYINHQLAALNTELGDEETELGTLNAELNQAKECAVPNSGVQCPSLSASQLQQLIAQLDALIASTLWAYGVLQAFMVDILTGTLNESGGYTQQTLTDLLDLAVTAYLCVGAAQGGFECYQFIGALQNAANGFPSSWFGPNWDPAMNTIQDMPFTPPCTGAGTPPLGFEQCM
jgi:hypothetical protein